ncbi:Integral membrane protein SED5 [Coemansia sp. RSA 1813]|nr:Integral membrane protein SED5 [Coemansia sp. RSA 1646]KAJ2213091.1 Integral membrane protein SED5 [Coemansia sp. RSA 487]KAJ2567212.1 Integral membrane protein SED5 [Coemansia sp. RSA 1813]
MSLNRAKTLRDRTNEYRSLTTALRKRQPNTPQSNVIPNSTHHTKDAFGEFSRQAGTIGKDIQETTVILEQLALLARGKTIFDDKTSEINTLTNQVKQRIAAINGKILSLQTLQRRQNGHSGKAGQHAAEHHSNIVVSLQSQLANTSTVFKDVLELRSESLKESGTRKEKFIGAAATGGTNNDPFSSSGVRNRRRNDDYNNNDPNNGYVDSPLYQAERKSPSYKNTLHTNANGESDDFVALSLPDMDASSSSQMMLTQQTQSSYLDTRSDAIASIESTISELGSIFQQLAHMVSEQRDVVQRIDANVENVDANISAAQNELLKYYSNISSNRWLMAKIFMVILVFVFLLVTFV